MSEEAPAAPAAPAAAPAESAPAVEQLPDATESGGEESFMSALDTAFEALDVSAKAEPEPAKAEPAAAEPAAAEPAKASFDPTDDISESLEEGWTPKAANRFKQLKSELKDNSSELGKYRQMYEESEQKIKELTGLTESNDIGELQEKIKSYEHKQTFTNLEETEAYQNAITRPLQEFVEQTHQIADKYDLDPDELVAVLSVTDQAEQDAKISDLLETASDRDKASIYQIINSIDPVLKHRQQLYENADAAMKEAQHLEDQRQQQQAADTLHLRQNVARNVVERVQQKLPFLSGIEGLDMATVQAKAAETDPSVIHPVDYAYNSVSAQLLPTVVREYMTMRAEVGALTDRLAEYEGAEPTMSGSSPTAQQISGKDRGDMSFEQGVDAAFAALG